MTWVVGYACFKLGFALIGSNFSAAKRMSSLDNRPPVYADIFLLFLLSFSLRGSVLV